MEEIEKKMKIKKMKSCLARRRDESL